MPSATPEPSLSLSTATEAPPGTKKIPFTGLPTENPNDTIVPGKMRSDREELPEGFTKEDADKAEIEEARLLKQRSMQRGVSALAAPTDCMYYWPSPHQVCGQIRVKYDSLGGSSSFLGPPTAIDVANPDNYGRRQTFFNGPIYWSPAGGAHPVVNHFFAAWQRNGWEAGVLKYPTTDEIVNPDGIGRRQEFQGGTIHWKLNEAYYVTGAIRDKWWSVGAETNGSLLGYPLSDQIVLPDGQGRMNRFERGVIYWSPNGGAHPVTGGLLSRYTSSGYEQGSWGYPIADSVVSGANSSQQFEFGLMSWPYTDAAAIVDDGDIEPIFVDGRTPVTSADFAYDARDGRSPAETFDLVSAGGVTKQPCTTTSSCIGGTPDPEEPVVDAPEPTPSVFMPQDCLSAAATSVGKWKAVRKQACLIDYVSGYRVKDKDTTKTVGRIPGTLSASTVTSHLSGKFVQEVTLQLGQGWGSTGIPHLQWEANGDHAGSDLTVTASHPTGSIVGSNTKITWKLEWNYTGVPQGQVDPRQTYLSWWFTNDQANIYSPSSRASVESDMVRCDNTMKTSGGQFREGCVISQARPGWAMNEFGDVSQASGHVLAALAAGLPGGSKSSLLQRTTVIADRNANRRQACPRGGKIQADRQAGVPDRSCDEYPFASTNQGARGKNGLGRSFNPQCHVPDLTSTTNKGYSVCMIDNTQNLRAGGQLGGFYGKNRVVNQDSYYVTPISGALPPTP
ncbi:hypothetical protein BH93_27005 (plasmid) [Rhodococcoides fascians A25f]|uniref:NucA/NucB deoxyribonuclease domain-containing protein n=1 Tax=Rhodococcoides fascians TaxID=1828 RepID=UPI00069013B1|nr:hypothetical protein [Rhodococcus fascians]QII09228.1 hypothetical protein BH93_27005 [Rhodococcus fascians A25f]